MLTFNRRGFLKAGAAFGSSLAISPYLMAQSSTRKIGVALLGLGYYSRDLLAPALQLTKHCELRGIITGSPHKIPIWQKRYGIADANVYSYDNMAQIANNPDIDVIYVVTPTSTHMDFTLAAANAGKHVWCEKPMAMTVEECQKMAQVCNQNKVALTLGYRMMHEPNTRTMAAYSATNPFGKITQVSCDAGYAGNGAPADNWRMRREMGGGALYDMGVYNINGVRFMLKQEPVAVTARFEKSHPEIFKEVDETTYMDLEFADGLIAKCATSVVKSFNQLKMQGEKGWYQLQPMQSYSGVVGTDSNGVRLAAFAGNQQANQMDNDALALQGKGPFITRPEDGINDIRVIQSTLQAAQSGKRVVITS